MKKNIDPTFLTAKQLTEMINLLIQMIKHLGHKIDIDTKSINDYINNDSITCQNDSDIKMCHIKYLFDQIELLKNSIKKIK